jgi:hypothetical protein
MTKTQEEKHKSLIKNHQNMQVTWTVGKSQMEGVILIPSNT